MTINSRQAGCGTAAAGTSRNAHQNAGERPPAMSHTDIDAALDRGEVVPLSQGMSWIARYQDAWWVIYEHGWLRITDELVASELDEAAARLAAAEMPAASGAVAQSVQPCPDSQDAGMEDH
jgi:hypothetical protein